MPGLVHILTHSNTHRHTCNEVLIDSYINTRLSLHLPMQTHTHTLQLLLHVSALRAPGPSAQTFSTSPLMENCSPFTSLFHILAAALSISFTAVTIALTDGPSTALHSHNARNPDITQYPEGPRGYMLLIYRHASTPCDWSTGLRFKGPGEICQAGHE